MSGAQEARRAPHTTADWARWTLATRRRALEARDGEAGGAEVLDGVVSVQDAADGAADGGAPEGVATFGDLPMAAFQRHAAARLVVMMERHQGAVLADAVGLGKTRVGLAASWALTRRAARRTGAHRSVLCCAPARLRRGWRAACVAAGLEPERDVQLVTHTEMSRGTAAPELERVGCIIVDEAHHFRNPRARRARLLATWARGVPLLLITATPVCNNAAELLTLLKLFLADDALRPALGCDLEAAFRAAERGDFDLSELAAEVIIRRTDAPFVQGFGRRPSVRWSVLSYDASPEEAWIWEHLEAHLRAMSWRLFQPRWPFGLLVEFVMRRWESGPEALRETLCELRSFLTRWLEAAREGRTLDREAFRALFGATAASRDQEVFPFMLDESPRLEPVTPDAQALRDSVARDREVLTALIERIDRASAAGWGRDAAILSLLQRDPHEKLLIFAGYQDAAAGLFARLRDALGSRCGVGLITGRTAQATGLGRRPAWEIIERFAPMANDAGFTRAHEQLRVLVATDCLAEGVNLQDCGRIVLADLPYSPLGVEQRIGRLVRPSGPHREVVVHLPRPRDWNDSLGMRHHLALQLGERLEIKIEDAARAGVPFLSTPSRMAPAPPQGPRQLGPLEALTALDQLDEAQRHHPAPALRRGAWFAARAPDRRPALWVFAWLTARGVSRPIWCRVSRETRAGEEVEVVEARLAALVPLLVGLLDAARPMRPAAPDARLLALAQEHLATREQLLRAAHLAPPGARIGSPQHRVWRHLCDALAMRAPGIDADALDALQHDLLRPAPAGLTEALAQLADEADAGMVTASEIAARAARLTVTASSHTDQLPRVQILGGLMLT